MLTFLVLRTYNIATLLRSLASFTSFTTLQVATLLMGWVGVGWGGMLTFLVLRTYNIATLLRSLASFTTLQVAVCHQRNQFTRKTAQKVSTRPCLAGTQMISDRQGMAFTKVSMVPCSFQCHAEEAGSHCSFSNSFGTRVSMGLATAPRTHVTKSVLESIARSPETLKKWDETTIHECSMQE